MWQASLLSISGTTYTALITDDIIGVTSIALADDTVITLPTAANGFKGRRCRNLDLHDHDFRDSGRSGVGNVRKNHSRLRVDQGVLERRALVHLALAA